MKKRIFIGSLVLLLMLLVGTPMPYAQQQEQNQQAPGWNCPMMQNASQGGWQCPMMSNNGTGHRMMGYGCMMRAQTTSPDSGQKTKTTPNK